MQGRGVQGVKPKNSKEECRSKEFAKGNSKGVRGGDAGKKDERSASGNATRFFYDEGLQAPVPLR